MFCITAKIFGELLFRKKGKYGNYYQLIDMREFINQRNQQPGEELKEALTIKDLE